MLKLVNKFKGITFSILSMALVYGCDVENHKLIDDEEIQECVHCLDLRLMQLQAVSTSLGDYIDSIGQDFEWERHIRLSFKDPFLQPILGDSSITNVYYVIEDNGVRKYGAVLSKYMNANLHGPFRDNHLQMIWYYGARYEETIKGRKEYLVLTSIVVGKYGHKNSISLEVEMPRCLVAYMYLKFGLCYSIVETPQLIPVGLNQHKKPLIDDKKQI